MFTSESMREYCGPDGGNGGNGAHIVMKADVNTHPLSNLPSVIVGENGEGGASKGCHGKSANHVFVKVPLGSIIYEVKDGNGGEMVKKVADLEKEDDFMVVARGGQGGRGNKAFLANEQRAPAFGEKGGKGEQRRIAIEMKLIADIGLIGLPNAGKSSLLNAVSRARPKIASYPFTTLKPAIGMIDVEEDASKVSVADLPGIIEGAHLNKGLGLDFLRHIERCWAILFVIDLNSNNPVGDLNILRDELARFNSELLNRNCAIAANKIDLPGTEEKLKELTHFCAENKLNWPIIAISAQNGSNIEDLKKIIFKFTKRKPC